jgi:hypothetical protein
LLKSGLVASPIGGEASVKALYENKSRGSSWRAVLGDEFQDQTEYLLALSALACCKVKVEVKE